MRIKKKRKTNYLIVLVLIFVLSRFIIKDIGNKLSYHIENIVIKNVNKSVYNSIFIIFGSDELGNENLLNAVSLNANNDGEIVSIDYKMNIA